jgi:hypothetical protein
MLNNNTGSWVCFAKEFRREAELEEGTLIARVAKESFEAGGVSAVGSVPLAKRHAL